MAARQSYSKGDDDAMWRYLCQQALLGNEDAYAPMGCKIWKSASESGITNKSVHSMTCHFRRKLLPAIHKAPLSKEQLNFLLSKWQLKPDQINSKIIDDDVTIEEYESSNSSADGIIVENVVNGDRKGADKRRRRVPVGRLKRLIGSPNIALGAPFLPMRQIPQASTSEQPLSKSPRLTLADALPSPTAYPTVQSNERPMKSAAWPLVDMEELQNGKKSLIEMKDVDASFFPFEYSEPESAEFQSKLMALIRQGVIPPGEIETARRVQSGYVIELAKEFNISLRILLGMIIANDEYRDSKKLREALRTKKERANRAKADSRPTLTAETN